METELLRPKLEAEEFRLTPEEVQQYRYRFPAYTGTKYHKPGGSANSWDRSLYMSACGATVRKVPRTYGTKEKYDPCLSCFPELKHFFKDLDSRIYLPVRKVFELGYVVGRYGTNHTAYHKPNKCAISVNDYYVVDSLERLKFTNHDPASNIEKNEYYACRNCFREKKEKKMKTAVMYRVYNSDGQELILKSEVLAKLIADTFYFQVQEITVLDE